MINDRVYQHNITSNKERLIIPWDDELGICMTDRFDRPAQEGHGMEHVGSYMLTA